MNTAVAEASAAELTYGTSSLPDALNTPILSPGDHNISNEPSAEAPPTTVRVSGRDV